MNGIGWPAVALAFTLWVDCSFAKPSCQAPPESQWHWSLSELVQNSPDIFVAELISQQRVFDFPDLRPDFQPDRNPPSDPPEAESTIKWTFKIVETLKGDSLEGQVWSFKSLERRRNSEPPLTPVMCDYKLSFAKSHRYLIVKDSFHPDGYHLISGKQDRLYIKIRSLLKPITSPSR